MAKAKRTFAAAASLQRHSVITLCLVYYLTPVYAVVTPLNPQLSYLPGVGTYINPGNADVLRVSRSQSSTILGENLDNPFLAPSDSFDASDERALSGSGQPLEPFQPPLDAGDGKCSYVQVPIYQLHLNANAPKARLFYK
jgi:hypothetical protein